MDIQDRKLLIIERIIRIDSESLLEQIDELLNQEGFKINEERKIKDDPTWRGILNLAGFALIVTFWQGFFSRICELPIVPPGWTQSIKDYSEIFLIGVVLCAAWVRISCPT